MKNVFVVILVLLVFGGEVLGARTYAPQISGNYAQGQRIYTEDEGSGSDYLFREGWINYRQKLSTTNYYYLKCRAYANDYVEKNHYDSMTIDLTAHLTYQLLKPLKLKTEVNLRDKVYAIDKQKNYHAIGSEIEFIYKVFNSQLSCNLSVQRELYLLGDRDNILSGVNLSWKRDWGQRLMLNLQYKISNQDYLAPEGLADRLKQSVSIGFEYQL